MILVHILPANSMVSAPTSDPRVFGEAYSVGRFNLWDCGIVATMEEWPQDLIWWQGMGRRSRNTISRRIFSTLWPWATQILFDQEVNRDWVRSKDLSGYIFVSVIYDTKILILISVKLRISKASSTITEYISIRCKLLLFVPKYSRLDMEQ